jgi:hypothetical protein
VLPSLVVAAAALLLLCYAVDRSVYPAHGLLAWLGFRWRLSLAAATSCFVAAAAG